MIVPCKKAEKKKQGSSESPCTIVHDEDVCIPAREICLDCQRSYEECHREWDGKWETIFKISKGIKEVYGEMWALKKTYERSMGIILETWYNDADIDRDTYWDLYRQQMEKYFQRGKKKLEDWYNVYDPHAFDALREDILEELSDERRHYTW
ncbi:hypothetical protein VTH82DRAFT_5483 [Thermothelomyces myriococcoides]